MHGHNAMDHVLNLPYIIWVDLKQHMRQTACPDGGKWWRVTSVADSKAALQFHATLQEGIEGLAVTAAWLRCGQLACRNEKS